MEFLGKTDQPQEQVPAQPQIDPYLDPFLNTGLGTPSMNLFNQKEYLDVLKHYTEDDIIPKEVKTSQWSVFGRGLALTFLDEKDLPVVDMFSNILRIDALMNQPAHDLTFEQTHQLDQTQLYFYIQAKRAIGSNKGKMNERTLQVTQIGQSIMTQTINQQQKSKSMMQRLRGMF